MPLEYYEGHFYIEPNNNYRFYLPDLRFLTIEDSLNPYFTPTIILPFETTNGLSLQNCIINFDDDLNKIIAVNYAQIFYKFKKSKFDSLINSLKRKYEKCFKSTFFQDYFTFSIAKLKFIAYVKNYKYATTLFFENSKILYDNDAYWDLFNLTYSDFLITVSNEKWAQNLSLIINKTHSLETLKKMFKESLIFKNDTLIELILLKSFHDYFYNPHLQGTLIKESILMLIDSLKNNGINEKIRNIASNIKTKLKNDSLKNLFFNCKCTLLTNEEKILYELFDSQYVYLSIYDFRAYNFLLDMKIISGFFNELKDKLKIINIVINADKNKLAKMINEENFIGIFCLVNENELKKYSIKALPMYILITPDKKINKNIGLPNKTLKTNLTKLLKLY